MDLLLSGFAMCWSRRGARVVSGTSIENENARGATAFGALTSEEATRLVDTLARREDPGEFAPDVPWAAAVARTDGSLRVACSPMLSAGVFYSRTPDRGTGTNGDSRQWVVATDPGRLITSSGWSWSLDEEWIGDFVGACASPIGTPYRGMSRLLPGQTLTIDRAGHRQVRTWCGPDAWSEPDLDERRAPAAFLEAFDDVIRTLAGRAGPVTTELSGGLDSTFMVASLARGGVPGDEVNSFVAAPLPGARPRLSNTDDEPFARLMQRRYPDVVRVRSVRNEARRQPLDVAAEVTARAWWPSFATANLVWMVQINERARELGSQLLFVGQGGNAAFSWDHSYAAPYYLRRLRWGKVARLAWVTDADLAQRIRLFRHRVLRPLFRNPVQGQDSRFVTRDFRALDPHVATDRTDYLGWLAGHSSPFPALSNPAAFDVLRADPFRARSVLDCAARITPAAWNASASDRGFARMMGSGRVPDEIRLRPVRGRQASDAWLWIHDQRDRYLAEGAELARTPAVAAVVDTVAIRDAMANWSWGDPSRPPKDAQLPVISRILALAQFCRMSSARLPRGGVHAHSPTR